MISKFVNIAKKATVIFRSYSGTRFKMGSENQEFRLINDDTVGQWLQTQGELKEYERDSERDYEINTEPQTISVAEEDMEIEVVDDRPMEDRVPPRAEAEPSPSDDDSDDEAAEYSERVQKRIKKLKYDYHEERRAKESADRERDEAVGFAQRVYQEAKP